MPKYKKFTEESYTQKQAAVEAMTNAGMSLKQISKALNISNSSTSNLRRFKTWEDYQNYLEERLEAKHTQVKAKQEAELKKESFYSQEHDVSNNITAIGMKNIDNKLNRIEAKLDLMLSKRKLFR